MIENIIAIAITAAIITSISLHLIKAKRKGHKCVGCPYAKQCAKKKSGTCAPK